MKSSWRQRPTGSWFARLWRPWIAINPFRGRGRRINEPRPVGLRDIVASPQEIASRPARRFIIIGTFFILLFGLLVYRLFSLQVVEYSSAVASVESNSLHTAVIPATRGFILDRTGIPLVGNNTVTEIQLSRAQAHLHPNVIGALALLTHQKMSVIVDDLNSVQYSEYQPAPIMLEATPTMVDFIKQHPGEFPGVTVSGVAERRYTYGGQVAAQVLGYVGPITQAELSASPGAGYTTSSVYGKTGIEAYYEPYLRGVPGASTVTVNARNSIIGTTLTKEPQSGDDVVLNIDAGLQQNLDSNLAADVLRVRHTVDSTTGILPPATNAAAIVLDAQTGAVLAMSSYPSYNLDTFLNGGLSEKTFKQLLASGSFNNYAIQGLYTPGSTFKMISATAQLQSRILSADQPIDDTGSFTIPNCRGGSQCTFHDNENEVGGVVNLALALTKSSDYYFYNLGYLFWTQQSRYGQSPIENTAASYGLGQYTNIDLPNEVEGRVDSPATRQELHAGAPQAFPDPSWYTGDNVEMAFGQGMTALTPIEMADAYATFANGGTRYEPEVAAGVASPTGKVIIRYQPRILGHVALPPSVRNPILQGLEGVVQNPAGTAYATFQQYATFTQAQFPVAGKTGTASNKAGEEPNSWFVSFAPANQPKYVVLTVVAQGGYGASAAAPVVVQTLNYLYAHPVAPVSLTPRIEVGASSTTKDVRK